MATPNPKFEKRQKQTCSRDIVARLLDLLLVLHRRETGLCSRFDLLIVKNSMIYANLMANLAGVVVMRLVMFRSGLRLEDCGLGFFNHPLYATLIITIFLTGGILTIVYEAPIRRALNAVYYRSPRVEEFLEQSRRRMLNEPYFIICLDLGLWLVSGMILTLVFYLRGRPGYLVVMPLLSGLNTGLIIAAVVFFMSEHLVQHHMVPYFFLKGGVSRVPGVIRTHIVVRLAILFLAINIIPLLAQVQLMEMMTHTYPELSLLGAPIRSAVVVNALVFIVVGVIITIQVGINMSLPFRDIIRVLEAVRQGRFDQKVVVTSTDEIGYTGDAINDMTAGLEDRDRMKRSLVLAREVQQNLLPKQPPVIDGLDIAGRAIFCDETGGDFFDYLDMSARGDGKLGLVVADVSDHGLQAALVMVSVRAYLRHHAYHNDPLVDIVADVNQHLCHDVGQSGDFVTLFLGEINRQAKRFSWVRAGHDPALVYDRQTGRFTELMGRGVPLGISDEAVFEEQSVSIGPGQILVMMTDGVLEARNSDGAYFGKDHLKRLIQAHSDDAAEAMIEAVVAELEAFTGSTRQKDDVTLLVVKVED